jgi:hypothetical protein
VCGVQGFRWGDCEVEGQHSVYIHRRNTQQPDVYGRQLGIHTHVTSIDTYTMQQADPAQAPHQVPPSQPATHLTACTSASIVVTSAAQDSRSPACCTLTARG